MRFGFIILEDELKKKHFLNEILTSPRSLKEYKVCPSNATSAKAPLCCAKKQRI